MKILILLILIICGGNSYSQAIDDYFVETNGVINDIDSDSNYVYFGGQFTQVNKYSGSGVVFSTNSTKIDYKNKYKIYGTVNDAKPDGTGGWYICGDFTRIGEHRIESLAHIFSDGSLDTNFYISPNPYSNNYKKLIIKNDFIYVLNSGTIIKVNNINNEKIELRFPFHILDFDVDDNYLYFSSDKEYDKSDGYLDYVEYNIFRVYKHNYEIDSTFKIDPYEDRYEVSPRIIKLNKNTLYYVTDYSTIKKIDLNTNIIDENWKIEINGTYQKIYDFKFDDNNIYIAGYFSGLNNTEVNNFAKINLSTLEINKNWEKTKFGYVGKFDLDDNSIYLYHLRKESLRIEKVNKFKGEIDSNFNHLKENYYNYFKQSDQQNIFNVISKSNDKLFLGGNFSTFNEGYNLTNLFRYNIKENKVDTNFNLNINYRDVVNKIKVTKNNLYLQGYFYDRSKEKDNFYSLIKFDLINNLLDYLPILVKNIHEIEYDKEHVYIGGDFKISDNIKNLFRFNKNTYAIDSNWTPNPNGTVEALKIDKDMLYVGGKFDTIYNKNIVYLAKLDIYNSTIIEGFNLGFLYNPKFKKWRYEIYGVNLIEENDDFIYVNAHTETKDSLNLFGLCKINKKSKSINLLDNGNWSNIVDLVFKDGECYAVDYAYVEYNLIYESLFKIDLEKFQIDTKWYCDINDEGNFSPKLNFAGNYLYYSTSGKISNYNRFNLFRFNNKDINLEKPVLLFPENMSMNNYNQPQLITKPVKEANRYYTIYSTDIDFKKNNYSGSNYFGIENAVYTKPSNYIYWKTRVSNEFTTSEWSDIYSFKIRFAAPKILNSVIEDTLYLNYSTDLIEWENLGDNFQYFITADEDYEFNNRYIDSISINENKFLANNLNDSSNYHFNVYASESDTLSLPAYLYLKVLFKKIPTSPIKIFPENTQHLSKVDLKLFWKNTRDVEINHLQLSKDPLFKSFIIDDDSIKVYKTLADDVMETKSYDLEILDSNTTYYWRVKGINKLGDSDFGEIWSFTTDEKFLDVDLNNLNDNSFRVYPNPANSILNIESNNQNINLDKIEILDLNGKSFLKQDVFKSKIDLDIRFLPTGTYLIKIKSQNENKTFKFIKN